MYKEKKENKETDQNIKIACFIKVEQGMRHSIIELLKKIPSISKISSITGEFDLLIEINTPSPNSLYEEYTKKIDIIPGIKNIHSHYITKSWIK